ncbi:MAG: hypothetical protein A4E36_00869 [Methanoregulaceae archaeon PtaB.Bin009]|jgi:hypothetical protein|nr:MAG: hypothetical protein A4E36_00869 [Methanoregulaceae archaeon PtaB.Bin009]OPY41875.1 MAG: hypothetical protein A4E41_00694 [Methanoregulaceae archaeon PtaU1.Bin066]HNQ29408.1 DUF4956 domain-containing protein [Methanolinea sp.]
MLIDATPLFIAGFVLNFLAAFIIVRFVYYPRGRCNNYVFTFLAFNTVIYFIMGMFTSVEISIGAGFGLFALFSILRYRTETVPIREMTYLFVMAALPILNSIFWQSAQYEKLLIVDILVIAVIWFLDREWGFNREQFQMNVMYEKIDLVKRERRREMLADLCERTGLAVTDAEVQSINFLRDVAELKVTYTNRRHD